MGSINRSHIETDGGILLYNGELILLYCESINFELAGQSSFKGRVFLTTHRLVTIINPYRSNAPIKSVCAPFSAIVKCSVEQPLFGANYIEATVREEADPNKSFSFKMKFPKGGAIEMAMAMNKAVARVNWNQQNRPMDPPPAYSPSPAADYYQAPPTVYSPGYDSGIQMPVNQFPDQPPIGFIYASTAPPPYPGLNQPTGTTGTNHYPSATNQPQQPPPPSYSHSAYPSASQYPSGPQPYQPASGAPAPGSYPAPESSYPAASQASYTPGAHPPYPAPTQPSGTASNYPFPQQQPNSQYPQLNPPPTGSNPMAPGNAGAGNMVNQQSAWPTAPSFNPEWSDAKKQA